MLSPSLQADGLIPLNNSKEALNWRAKMKGPSYTFLGKSVQNMVSGLTESWVLCSLSITVLFSLWVFMIWMEAFIPDNYQESSYSELLGKFGTCFKSQLNKEEAYYLLVNGEESTSQMCAHQKQKHQYFSMKLRQEGPWILIWGHNEDCSILSHFPLKYVVQTTNPWPHLAAIALCKPRGISLWL